MDPTQNTGTVTPEPAPAVAPAPAPAPTAAPAPTDTSLVQPESLLGKDLEVPKGEEPPKEELPKEEPPKAPEPFKLEDVALPEGLEISDEVKGTLTEIATKHALSKDAASELIALHAKLAKDQTDRSMQLWYDTQKTWVDQVKKDPDFVGEKLPLAQATIAQAIQQYGTPEVRQAFDLTGAGSNPAIFKFVHSMARALSEGREVNGGNPPGGSQKTMAERMYPNHTKG